MEELKKCSKCGELLPHSAFNKNARRRDGLQIYCRDCQKAIARKFYENHEGYNLQKVQEWYKKNPQQAKILRNKANNKARKNLNKSQVANDLRIPVKDLSEELYQLKRNSMLIYRELKATNTSAAI